MPAKTPFFDTCYRVTAPDRSTARIRHGLVDAHRALAIAEDAAFRLV